MDASATAAAGTRMAEPDEMVLQKIRYGIILNRLPFGPNPPTLAQGGSKPLSPAELAALEEARKNGENLRIRLTSISRYRGVPAAGLLDLETGRSLLLRAGERIGPFHLLEVSPAAGGVLLEDGTNTYFIAISYGRNQASNLVHSADAKRLTVFRPVSASSAFFPSVQPDAAAATPEDSNRQQVALPPLSAAQEKAAREQEEALFLKQATIRNADGTERISYVTLNRLRAEAARKRAEEVRAAAEALAKEQAELARAEAAAREEEARAAAEAEKAEKRTEILEAIRQGLDVQEEIELTAEEAAELEQSGFSISSSSDNPDGR
ncbi:MAG: hypothetical protein ACI4QT_08045 [Kiritimatiellia bacterium]